MHSSAEMLRPSKPAAARESQSSSLLHRRLELMKTSAAARARAAHRPTRAATADTHNKEGESSAEVKRATPPLMGMHDPDFYASVARELGVEEPLLHSVVHVHRHLLSTSRPKSSTLSKTLPAVPTSAQPERQSVAASCPAPEGTTGAHEKPATAIDDDAGRELTLEEELWHITDELNEWKVQRLSERLEATDVQRRSCAVETEMGKRLWTKRTGEQDRALRRMHGLMATLEPKLKQRLAEERASEEQAARTGERSEQQPFDSVCTAERAAYMKHRVDREARLQDRLGEIRSFTQSWLVERDLQRKYEDRESLARQHWFMAQGAAQEEKQARRALLSAFLSASAVVGFVEDELQFRAEVVEEEEEERDDIVDRLLSMTRTVAMSADGSESDEEELEDTVNEEEDDAVVADDDEAAAAVESGNGDENREADCEDDKGDDKDDDEDDDEDDDNGVVDGAESDTADAQPREIGANGDEGESASSAVDQCEVEPANVDDAVDEEQPHQHPEKDEVDRSSVREDLSVKGDEHDHSELA